MATINLVTATPSADRVITLPDPGADAFYVMTEGAQTIHGIKTFRGDAGVVIEEIGAGARTLTFTPPLVSSPATLLGNSANGLEIGATANGPIDIITNNASVATYTSSLITLKQAIDLPGIAAPSNPVASNLKLWADINATSGDTRPAYADDDGLKIIIGRDNFYIVRNETGSTIAANQCVYIVGQTGTVPNVALAKADSMSTLPAIGMTMAAIANHAFGYVQSTGLQFFDTHTYTTGTNLYVSPTTAGALTSTRPVSPLYAQRMGTVVVSGIGTGSFAIVTAPFVGGVESGTTSNYTFGGTITTPLTANRALTTGAAGILAVSNTTDTQLGYLSTTTSDVQTQLNGKQATLTQNSLTASSPLSLSAAVTVIGAGAALSIATAASGVAGVISATTQTLTGIKTFETQLIGKGTATNDSPSAGYIGEVISNTGGSSNFPASGSYGDLTSISVTAGDWMISGAITCNLTSSSATLVVCGAGTTSGDNPPISNHDGRNYQPIVSGASDNTNLWGPVHIQLASTTTYYLKYRANYSGTTPTATGVIKAQRIR